MNTKTWIYSSHLSFRRCCNLVRHRSCTVCTLPRLVRLRLAENPIAVSILFLFTLLLSFNLNAAKLEESDNPLGCQNVGHHYVLKTLIVSPGEAGSQQTLFMFYNQLDKPVTLFQMRGEDSVRSLFLNHTIQPHQWSALAASEPFMRFICATPATGKKRYGEVIDCSASIKVCELTSVRYGMNNRGNFWMVNNGSRGGVLSAIVHYGVIP